MIGQSNSKKSVSPKRIETNLILKSFLFQVLIIAIIFIGAGRIDYWQGWLFSGLNMAFFIISYFLLPPELIKERLKMGKEGMKKWDKIYFVISTPISFSMLIISTLDGGRFSWEPRIPFFLIIIGAILYLTGQAIVLWAKKVNRFFFTVVCIQEGQT
ncbi:MAG: hypothetical protein DRJ38_09835, partial [Thermoprotei archaeon]